MLHDYRRGTTFAFATTVLALAGGIIVSYCPAVWHGSKSYCSAALIAFLDHAGKDRYLNWPPRESELAFQPSVHDLHCCWIEQRWRPISRVFHHGYLEARLLATDQTIEVRSAAEDSAEFFEHGSISFDGQSGFKIRPDNSSIPY